MDFFTSGLFWFLLSIVLMVSEFFIPGLILIFVGFGALFVSILTWIGILQIFNVQLLVCFFSSVLFLLFLRRFFKKTFQGVEKVAKTTDGIVGEEAIVKKVLGDNRYEIYFKGALWKAESEDELKQDEWVRIIGKDSVVLKIKRRQ
ncbi:NfeD family protein [bacterium]